ncbi:MAG: amidohydrolase [Clostridia bacterium]|nr:amidohydrolase [Clostridia bacterium]
MNLAIENARLWTNGDKREIQPNASIHVEDGIITYAGPRKEPEWVPDRTIDAQNNLVLPSFFNSHSHVAMNILRGYAEGLPLQEWLHEKIFPAEAKLTDEMAYWSSLAAMCEQVRAGITGFNDMYDHVDAIARAAQQSGMRAVLARGIVSRFGSPEETEAKVREAEEAFQKWNGQGRILVFFSPHAQYTTDDEVVARIGELARHYQTGIHTHLSETREEHEQCLRETGMTPTAYFASMGLMDGPFIAAHGVHMTDDDMRVFASKGACLAACVRSNLKLGSGLPRLTEMRRQGMVVALGTDGASSNNRLSVASEMDVASLLQKGMTGDSAVFGPEEMLDMVSAAACSEIGIRSGRLESGWNADMIIVDTGTIRFSPHWDDLSSLVYSAMDTSITTTICGGDVLYEDGRVNFCDEEEVMRRLQESKRQLV